MLYVDHVHPKPEGTRPTNGQEIHPMTETRLKFEGIKWAKPRVMSLQNLFKMIQNWQNGMEFTRCLSIWSRYADYQQQPLLSMLSPKMHSADFSPAIPWESGEI